MDSDFVASAIAWFLVNFLPWLIAFVAFVWALKLLHRIDRIQHDVVGRLSRIELSLRTGARE